MACRNGLAGDCGTRPVGLLGGVSVAWGCGRSRSTTRAERARPRETAPMIQKQARHPRRFDVQTRGVVVTTAPRLPEAIKRPRTGATRRGLNQWETAFRAGT